MKKLIVLIVAIGFMSFNISNDVTIKENVNKEIVIASSFSLINDTKNKVSIYTGTGFVTLNKGSKTSISCKAGKEVRWAKSGTKGAVIFKIKSSHCGKTLKLSKLI